MKFILTLILTVVTAIGEDIYIAATDKGNASGNSAANAHAYTWFNASASWADGAGKIGPGDTVHITGVINLTTALVFGGSGTPGNPVTLKFDPGAQLRHATSWGNGMIHIFRQHDVTVEGGNPNPVIAAYNGNTDFRAPAGYQEDMVVTANGTEAANKVEGTRYIHGEELGSNVTIRNLWGYGLYIRTYQHPSDTKATGAVISLRTGGSNVVIENCAFVHGESGPTISAIGSASGTMTGWRISNNLILDCSNGVKMGIGPSLSIMDGGQIVRNRIDHNQRWGGVETGGFHSDGIQTISQGSGRCDNLRIAYNRIGPSLGLSGDITAFIFLEDYVNGFMIYNNILEKGEGGHTSNPVITSAVHSTFAGKPFEKRSVIAFNTVLHNDPHKPMSTGINGGTALVVGNIAYRTHQYLLLDNNDSFAGGPLNNWSDYNIWFGADDDAPMSMRGATVGGNGMYSVSAWLDRTPYDKHSKFTSNPMLTKTTAPADLRLQAGSPAIGMVPTTIDGVDITTLFTDDYFGAQRGAGPWDAGAVKYGTSAPTPSPAPTATPGPTPPPPVLSFALFWNAVPNASSYVVYENGEAISETPGTTYNLEGKVGPKNYQVSGKNSSGEGAKSNQVTLPAAPSPTPTPAPSATPTPVPVPAAPVLEIRQQQ